MRVALSPSPIHGKEIVSGGLVVKGLMHGPTNDHMAYNMTKGRVSESAWALAGAPSHVVFHMTEGKCGVFVWMLG